MKEKSIEGSNAKFTWGVKNGKELILLYEEMIKMKKRHFDVESDGFYGAYWKCRWQIYADMEMSKCQQEMWS